MHGFHVALLAGAAWAVASTPSQGASALYNVGPTVQVSRGSAERVHDEVFLAAHPTDPKRLIGCVMVDLDRYAERLLHVIAYTTEDGGATWKAAAESSEFVGDPMCGYDPAGGAYLIGIGTDDESWKDSVWWMEILRSEDGGRAWGKGMRMPGGDRPYLAFDFSDGPTRGVGYVVYSIRATILDKKEPTRTLREAGAPTLEVRRTTDGGRTWEKTAVGVGTNLSAFPTATGAAVLSDGTFVTLWLERPMPPPDPPEGWTPEGRKALYAVTAGPGADMFRRGVKIADFEDDLGESGTFYTLAADPGPGPTRDRLYAAWTDRRGGPRSRIMGSRSSDGGATWSAPVAVNAEGLTDRSAARDDYAPTLAVNRDGIVGIIWRRRSRVEEDAEVWFAASRDGGASWLPAARVSAPGAEVDGGVVMAKLRPSDDGVSPGSRPRKFFKGGDTAGLAADANGAFHALWSDQRSGIGQTYTATVRVAAPKP